MAVAVSGAMLQAMEPSAQTQPSPTSSNFAGLLAALTSPIRDAADVDPPWGGSDLSEDVETLSYERALRAHARYRPADRGDWQLAQETNPSQGDEQEAPPVLATPAGQGLPVQAGPAKQAETDRYLRSASVTIRLSKAECARLHQRAAEAGVTVSAYLRSCTFEAEALRAEVKAALAELRKATSGEKPAAPARERRSWFGWVARFFPIRRWAALAR